jgi:hypothetical protein
VLWTDNQMMARAVGEVAGEAWGGWDLCKVTLPKRANRAWACLPCLGHDTMTFACW